VKSQASAKVVRIGGASGFWGDSSLGPMQLVRAGGIDYLVFDYLAELTMSILAGARMKRPEEGYATDFVTVALRSVLKQAVEQGIRIVSNAGGVNPKGCAAAVQALADELGVKVRIAVVEGDDVLPLAAAMRAAGTVEMSSGEPMPQRLVTANAYLGALPIAQALDAGADIVITGRCVDSAVTAGRADARVRLGGRRLRPARRGQPRRPHHRMRLPGDRGLHTDWASVPDWADIGYPIVECREDGSFVVTKPPQTGGLVTPATVGEQLLYEIGDPASYLLPDVVCDFRQVRMEQAGPHRVLVTGARGRPPTGTYKVSATTPAASRCPGSSPSSASSPRQGQAHRRGAARARPPPAARERVRGLLATNIELLGTESAYGPACPAAADARSRSAPDGHACRPARAADVQPRVRRAGHIVVAGHDRRGRPSLGVAGAAAVRLAHCEGAVTPTVTLGETTFSVTLPPPQPSSRRKPLALSSQVPTGPRRAVPLVQIAWGRSGDKGDTSNIGLIARRPDLLAVLREQVTPGRVREYLGHLVQGPVHCYDLPGIDAINLVCQRALGGGGMASLRNDALGKGMAQMLLDMPVDVPESLLQERAS
jgi:hypothetical protein